MLGLPGVGPVDGGVFRLARNLVVVLARGGDEGDLAHGGEGAVAAAEVHFLAQLWKKNQGLNKETSIQFNSIEVGVKERAGLDSVGNLMV